MQKQFTVKVWTKRETQSILKKLRNAGFEIEKSSFGYISENDIFVSGSKPKPLFKAVDIGRGYAVTYYTKLFTE